MKAGYIFPYGSCVYNTNDEYSDVDLILVGEGEIIINGKCDCQYYSKEEFQELIDQHEISALECIFQGIEHEFTFNLDLEVLRRSISAKASNSWVKAKKKINQGDIRIGQKSLFHSLRIVMYGCQIAEHGQIIDYQCANKYWDIIKNIEDWELLKETFQPLKNQLNSKFRELAPLDKGK